jgi:ATP-dependent DNA helicase DinG
MTFPTPKQLGLPSKFKSWRPNQPCAIQDGLDSNAEFVVQLQRQGQGKTLTYMAQALIDINKRYIILTSTKGLQDQNNDDFASVGLVDIRGKSSYQCDGLIGSTCAEGTVAKCIYKGTSMCGYHNAKFEASTKRLVQSNYACYLAALKYSTGLGTFDVMVCDEAHNIPAEIERSAQVLLGEREIFEDLDTTWPDVRSRDDMQAWKVWAKSRFTLAEAKLQTLKIQLDTAPKTKRIAVAKTYNHYQVLSKRLAELSVCNPEEWVCDGWKYGYKFDPIDVSSLTYKTLFRAVPKKILTSGTLTRYSVSTQMGIPIGSCEFHEYQSSVNVDRTPIMYWPTTKVNRNIEPWQLRKLTARIDEIFEARCHHKGIIHTSSYKIRDFIMRNSKYAAKGFFISNYSQNGDVTGEVVRMFKHMEPPCVLVSPSLTTGYDFPYDMCRYQIIAKLAYPYAGSKVEQERLRNDPERSSAHAIVQLQQAATRGDRADDDFQEVFILDDAFPYLRWKYAHLFNPSFLACVKDITKMPKVKII